MCLTCFNSYRCVRMSSFASDFSQISEHKRTILFFTVSSSRISEWKGVYMRGARSLVRILWQLHTHISILYRRIPSAWGERMPGDNVPSADFRTSQTSAFAFPRYSAQKLGLNARHGNFSTISRAQLRDLRVVQNVRRLSSLGKSS